MGFLKTFTIYIDGVDQIKKNPKEFIEKLYNACLDTEGGSFGVGTDANLVKYQKVRHADNKTIYVHAGNTVCEMNPYSADTEQLAIQFPDFFEEMLGDMKFFTKQLTTFKGRGKNKN